MVRPKPGGNLRRIGGWSKLDRSPALPPRVLQGCGFLLRMPRQPDGQGILERAVDGLPGGSTLFGIFQYRQRPSSKRKTDADRGRTGQERPTRIDLSVGRCADQGRRLSSSSSFPAAGMGMEGATATDAGRISSRNTYWESIHPITTGRLRLPEKLFLPAPGLLPSINFLDSTIASE